MEAQTKTSEQRRRLKDLKHEANSWLDHWRDIAEHMLPQKGRYLSGDDTSENNDGKKKHQKIINGSANDALRIIAAGMQGGLTSPSRPWFVLSLADEELREYAPVREWLHTVRQILLHIFSRSNFYSSVHGMYKELAAFGTSAMFIEEDFQSVIRCRPMTIGEYFVALDHTYRPSVLYRQYAMTASQLVEKYGEKAVSEAVLTAFKHGSKETKFNIVHACEPRSGMNPKRKDAPGMAYRSMYFELNCDPDRVLKDAGYKMRPFVAPRWDVTGVDAYGSCPGMDSRGDVKMLQKMEADKLKALAKMVDPPMNAPSSMKGKGGTIVAGGVNYVDVGQGMQGFVPAYQVNPNLQNMAFEIDRVEQRIRRYFFNDLFLAILNNEHTMTATEVAKRHEEKMLMLGPVLERLQHELLDPVIDRVFTIAQDLDVLPPPPKELQGMDIKVEYISLLAQAQKMIGTTAIEQTAAFVGNLAAVNPEVLDKFDMDEAVDQYADMVGVPPRIIRSDDKVAEIRAAKAERAQAAEMMQNAGALAQGAKVMSDTRMNQNSALDVLMGNPRQ